MDNNCKLCLFIILWVNVRQLLLIMMERQCWKYDFDENKPIYHLYLINYPPGTLPSLKTRSDLSPWELILIWKELNLCHKLWFSNPYIFATKCRRPYAFQTMKSVRSNNLKFEISKVCTSGCNNIGIENLSLQQRLNSFAQKHCTVFWFWIKHCFFFAWLEQEILKYYFNSL